MILNIATLTAGLESRPNSFMENIRFAMKSSVFNCLLLLQK